jgi:cytochrome P450
VSVSVEVSGGLPSLATAEALQSPHAAFAELRERDPVHLSPEFGFYFVTRFDDCVAVVRDPETYSSNTFPMLPSSLSINPRRPAVDAILDQGIVPVATLVWADGLEHKRHSKLVKQAFSARRLSTLEPVISGLVDEAIAAMPDAGVIDLVTDFAVPVSVGVIANILGVQHADLQHFHEWTDAFLARLGTVLAEQDDIAAAHQCLALQNYIVERIEERRGAPRDDLLSDLVNGRGDEGETLSHEELVTILLALISAGNDTTRGLISSAMLELLRHPELLEQARGDDAVLAAVLEETLRVHSPAQYQLRVTTRETVLGGTTIPAGALVGLMWTSANRDPSRFERPDEFLLGRENAKSHLAFGYGLHFCVGSAVARAEGRLGIRGLLDAFDRIDLIEDAPRYLPTLMVRNLVDLPLRIRKKPTR